MRLTLVGDMKQRACRHHRKAPANVLAGRRHCRRCRGSRLRAPVWEEAGFWGQARQAARRGQTVAPKCTDNWSLRSVWLTFDLWISFRF